MSSEVKLANNTVTFLNRLVWSGAQRSHQATPLVFRDTAVTSCLFALNHPMYCNGDGGGGGKVTPHQGLPQCFFFFLIWAKLSMQTWSSMRSLSAGWVTDTEDSPGSSRRDEETNPSARERPLVFIGNWAFRQPKLGASGFQEPRISQFVLLETFLSRTHFPKAFLPKPLFYLPKV